MYQYSLNWYGKIESYINLQILSVDVLDVSMKSADLFATGIAKEILQMAAIFLKKKQSFSKSIFELNQLQDYKDANNGSLNQDFLFKKSKVFHFLFNLNPDNKYIFICLLFTEKLGENRDNRKTS